MGKKFGVSIGKFAAYYVCFALLALTERELGVMGFCAGFLFALLYCREKIYLTVPAYVGGILTVSFTLASGIYAGVGAIAYIVPYVVHFYKKRRYRIWEVALFALVTTVPSFFFADVELFPMLVCTLGVGIAEGFLYISIIALYPVLVRGLKYGLYGNEKFALGIIAAALCVGLSAFTPYSISVYIFVVTFAILFLKNLDAEYIMVFAVCAGVGAGIGSDVRLTAYTVLLGLLCYGTRKQNKVLTSAVTVGGTLLAVLFFNGKLDLFFIVPMVVGGIIPLFFTKRFFAKIVKNRSIYRERFALRTVVNRDREEVAERIRALSSAFSEMQAILIKEQPKNSDPETVVKAVCESTCLSCPRLNKCLQSVGDLAKPVRRLVHTAINSGKVSILDADVSLGNNCNKLSSLLNAVNEKVKLYKKRQEKLSGIEQGKEMVATELGGISVLLDRLASSINVNMTFSPEPERIIMEKLGKSNVIASDVCLYSDGKNSEVTAIVRESDADKPVIREVVSACLGKNMKEYSRRCDVNDTVSLHFCPSPIYKVLYGEAVKSDKTRCGDSRKAVKIGRTKLMFVISDGMGTGEEAQKTSMEIIKLIEVFYMAGFDHNTVFTNVSRLLSLREKEDFSALDMAIIDTQTGEIDFIKQGGRESYIFSKDGCEEITSDSLPIGIVESSPTVMHTEMPTDGVVVMLSDGVADVINKSKLIQIVGNISLSNPQTVADAILSDAIRLGDKDDMTVLVLRLVQS